MRLSLGESKTGRMNWWYPGLTGSKLLTSLSHSALRVEKLIMCTTPNGWQFSSKLTFAEEVKHQASTGETPRASYWAWLPVLARDFAEHVRVSILAGWLQVKDYAGAQGKEAMQGLQVTFKL